MDSCSVRFAVGQGDREQSGRRREEEVGTTVKGTGRHTRHSPRLTGTVPHAPARGCPHEPPRGTALLRAPGPTQDCRRHSEHRRCSSTGRAPAVPPSRPPPFPAAHPAPRDIGTASGAPSTTVARTPTTGGATTSGATTPTTTGSATTTTADGGGGALRDVARRSTSMESLTTTTTDLNTLRANGTSTSIIKMRRRRPSLLQTAPPYLSQMILVRAMIFPRVIFYAAPPPCLSGRHAFPVDF